MQVKLVYLLAYVVIISAVFFMPGWRALDWHLFSALHQSAPPRWDDDLAIVDVPYLNEQGQFSLVQYRSKVGALMMHLASAKQGRPAAVLFDISFGREVEGIDYLVRGLQALTSSNVRVYAPIDPLAKPASSANSSSLSEPLRLVTGVGHTLFERRAGVLVYRSELSMSDGTVVSAIPVRVAKDLYGRPETAVPEIIAVRVGPKEAYEQHTFKYDGRGDNAQVSPFVSGPSARLENKLVIVGSLEEDSDRFRGRSGPEVLAWAMLARMARTDEAVGPRPLDSPVLFAALLAVFPVTSVGVYRTTLRKLKKREGAMWLAAGFAVLLAVCGLGGLVAALYTLGHLYVQVTLVVVAIVVAVALACFATFHGQLLASLEADLESGKLQAAEIYDVFISYSREPSNAKWVEEHVFKPLASARHQDGTPFKIFFDTRSIRLGDFWYRRLALAIAASRYFVPIYSDDYFDKAFCQHEMTLALARSVKKVDFILPLRRTSKPVPPGYDHIQHIDVVGQRDFIKDVISSCSR